ncbi:MAG: PAS domain-containing protein [Planctomycetales bacterium]|nr:PAS domain-containing protein [Planctomycetales bacterium]
MNRRSTSSDGSAKTMIGLVGALWIILAISMSIHVGCLIAAHWWFDQWTWPNHPVHSSIEIAGGIVAIGVAWMLLSLQRIGAGTSYNVWIASALLGMGILDSLHAMVLVGQGFVWLHSAATLLGGTLFAMVWLPGHWQHRLRSWPIAVAASALIFGIVSMVFSDKLPSMSDEDGFTALAKVLNIGGGVLLFTAAVRLLITFRATGNFDDLLFFLHCALFGAAAIMFEQSKLWDFPWWGWHFLRLMAYGVALWFVVKTDARASDALRQQALTSARLSALQENAEQLKYANAELRREQYLVNSLVNTIPDAVFFKDMQGRVIRANQAMANDAGFHSPEELIGKTDKEIWAGDFHLQTEVDEQKMMQDGTSVVNKEEMPIGKSGDRRWVLVTKMPLRNVDGQVTGLFGVARDITEIKLQEIQRKEQAEALAAAKEALERSNADLQQFAYVASHDLQEPLRAVAGHCQLLEMALGDHPNERVTQFLHHAVDGAKRMQELINNLLEYSRVQTRGKQLIQVDLNDVVNDAMANLKVSIMEHDATIHVADLPRIKGDRDQLVRLFQNLVGNAIKFCGDKRPEIQIGVQEESDHVLLSVQDNGIGFENEYRERIFVIFQRLHSRTQYPGTGLGLAIAKRIVERHGGQIWVESEPGSGSTFWFTLHSE